MDANKIRKMTMEKVQSARRPVRRHMPRLTVIAAVLALSLLCTATAFACVKWSGFAFTGEMSKAEKQALLKDNAGGAMELVDPDGTVHYLDARGNERLVLSAQEALAYEQSSRAAREEAVQASTDLLDIYTTTLVPKSVTEVATGADGAIPDFMLGNGHLVLLSPEDADGYALHQADQVTIALDANDECILEFGMVKDGKTVEAESVRAQKHSHTFTIPQDGDYCFYIMYYSSDKSEFTDCRLIIE